MSNHEQAIELIEKFNAFIKKWCGDSYPHLIDSDENDGEDFRQSILTALQREPLDAVKVHVALDELDRRMKFPGNNYRARWICDKFSAPRKPEISRQEISEEKLADFLFRDKNLLDRRKGDYGYERTIENCRKVAKAIKEYLNEG